MAAAALPAEGRPECTALTPDVSRPIPEIYICGIADGLEKGDLASKHALRPPAKPVSYRLSEKELLGSILSHNTRNLVSPDRGCLLPGESA